MRPAGPGLSHGSGVFSAQKFSDVAALIDSTLLRTSGQRKKLNIVDRTHPALVRAVLQKSKKFTLLGKMIIRVQIP